MIREEVSRADQVITRLMGYAQLKEGRIEKLDVVEELERVLHEIFPPVAKYSVRIFRDFAPTMHMTPAGMVDHLRLIPRQVVQIVKEDPKVLDSYKTFVDATFGPQG